MDEPVRCCWPRVVLIAALVAAAAKPVAGTNIDTDGKLIVTGIVVVSAGVATAVTVIAIHRRSNKIAVITGCVAPGTTGVSITDEKSNRIYALSGDSTIIKSGERMTLEGKKSRQRHDTFVFQVHRTLRDFGPCQP